MLIVECNVFIMSLTLFVVVWIYNLQCKATHPRDLYRHLGRSSRHSISLQLTPPLPTTSTSTYTISPSHGTASPFFFFSSSPILLSSSPSQIQHEEDLQRRLLDSHSCQVTLVNAPATIRPSLVPLCKLSPPNKSINTSCDEL